MAALDENRQLEPARRKSAAAFRTIAEVAGELDLPAHVLRFWESKFPQIKPLKRRGGRRYYRPEDVTLLRYIRSLLYTEGYTIRGVQKLLREAGGGSPEPAVLPATGNEVETAGRGAGGDEPDSSSLSEILAELEAIRALLDGGKT